MPGVNLPNASDDFKRLNPGLFGAADIAHTAPRSQPEPTFRDAADGPPRRETIYAGRVRISITSVRKRLLDPDNLCPKYFIDCCRYAGFIPDDTAELVEISTTQRRCRKGEAEHTELTLTPL